MICISNIHLLTTLKADSAEDLANLLEESLVDQGLLPSVSRLSPNISEKKAYLIQKIFAEKHKKTATLGYKGAFFDLKSRQKFNVVQPISGILKSGCVFADQQTISLRQYPKLRLEIELGYRVRTSIEPRLDNSSDIKAGWFELVPVIEMPQIYFGSIRSLTAVDLIAGNVAASCWLEGKPVSNFSFDKLDSMQVEMFHDGKLIEAPYGKNVGGQKDALAWLIVHLSSRGVRIDKGDLLITGKLGRIHLPAVGRYAVKYGSFGVLNFSFVE